MKNGHQLLWTPLHFPPSLGSFISFLPLHEEGYASSWRGYARDLRKKKKINKNALKGRLLAYRVGAFWLTSMNSWEGLPMVSNLPKYLGSGFGRKSRHSLPAPRELIDLTGFSNGFMTPQI